MVEDTSVVASTDTPVEVPVPIVETPVVPTSIPIKPRGTIDATTWKKVGIGFVIALIGGTLTYLETLVGVPNLGWLGTAAQFAVNSGLVNLIRKIVVQYN